MNKINTALYMRLSREDGDKAESMSINNQRLLLTEFLASHKELLLYDTYIDDGFTGTDFNRPAFLRMLADIEAKRLQCVIVKDLSRLGRNMPWVSKYVNEYFPAQKIRFIAVSDGIDKQYDEADSSTDMVVDIKNLFNGFYPKDISKKVRSTLRAKQQKGQFIGAFACYGYKKCAADHNQLEIDEYAASIIRRIFSMYLSGMGQNTIAKKLNEEGILCPSEYKKQCGLNYRSSSSVSCLWSYSTIRKILQNETYIGSMVQNKTFRQICKKNAVSLPKEKWIIVKNTHEPIIDKYTWDRVQLLLRQNTRETPCIKKFHLFAGLLKCGNCGRAMVRIIQGGTAIFRCGSYNRFGKNVCSMHRITESELETVIRKDFNILLQSTKNLHKIIETEIRQHNTDRQIIQNTASKCRTEIDRLELKKEHAYEDYSDGIITKEDFLKYHSKYEQQIAVLTEQLSQITPSAYEYEPQNSILFPFSSWLSQLAKDKKLEQLDRATVVEMVSEIAVYEDHTLQITYRFFNETPQ